MHPAAIAVCAGRILVPFLLAAWGQLGTGGCVTFLARLEMRDEMATSGFREGAASSGPNSATWWELFEFKDCLIE